MFGLRLGAMGRVGSGLTLNQAAANVRAAYSASPQVWYDPSDLVWNWRRNLLTYSEQFDNAAWLKLNGSTVTANATTAPDGTTTADKLASGVVSGYHATRQIFAAGINGAAYTVTCCMKAAGYDYGVISDTAFDRFAVSFLLTGAGSVANTAGGGNITATSITSLGDGWYRCTVSFKHGTSQAWPSMGCSPTGTVASGGSIFTGDGTSGIFLWGAQLEVGTAATPYQRITDGVQDYYQYHPLPTLYQDSAGTTPVTAVGQPVGLMLDKSRGLVLGSELVTNGGFDSDTVWIKGTGWTITGGQLVATSVAAFGTTRQNGIGLTGGKTYRITLAVTQVTAGGVFIIFAGGTSASGPAFTAAGTYTFFITTNTGNVDVLISSNASGFTGTITSISVRELPGLHASQPTALARPVLQQENGLMFLLCDGTDDGMVTPSWDLTSTDKATVVAGVRKLSDAAVGTVLETSASSSTTAGTFGLFAPRSGSSYGAHLRGTTSCEAATTVGNVAPSTNVVTTTGNIAAALGSEMVIRVNGTAMALTYTSTDAGTGTLANQPLYLFRRGGTTLPFNGRFYGLSIIGAALSASDINVLERFTASKVGISL